MTEKSVAKEIWSVRSQYYCAKQPYDHYLTGSQVISTASAAPIIVLQVAVKFLLVANPYACKRHFSTPNLLIVVAMSNDP